MLPEYRQSEYNRAMPDAHAMIGDAVAQDRKREAVAAENLPVDIQKKLSRIRWTQTLIALGVLILFFVLLLLFGHR